MDEKGIPRILFIRLLLVITPFLLSYAIEILDLILSFLRSLVRINFFTPKEGKEPSFTLHTSFAALSSVLTYSHCLLVVDEKAVLFSFWLSLDLFQSFFKSLYFFVNLGCACDDTTASNDCKLLIELVFIV